MEIKTVTYQCPNCGAALEYDNSSGRLSCKYCGGSFSEADVKRLFKENEAEPLSQENLEREREAAADETNIEAEGYSGVSALYTCPNCGAGVICDSLTASTRCHFCHTPVILTGRLSGEFKPDIIIPFKLTRQAAEQAFKEYCKGKFLLPHGFTSEAQIQNITPLYVPYWLKSGTVEAQIDAEAKKIRTWHSGNTTYVNTKVYNVLRDGRLTFVRVPCDGSRRIDDSLMESIEPFDYDGIKPFSMSYLSGCGAEKYDVTSDMAEKRIDERIKKASEEYLKADIKGYTKVRITQSRMEYTSKQTVYALLPVWFLNYTYKGKDYPFVMNGQTGNKFGILPVSIFRRILLSLAISAALSLAVGFVGGVMLVL